MPRSSAGSPKAERDQLRDRMHGLGCSVAQIAAEMSRRLNLRPRLAWRHALGWPQWKLAAEYNKAHPGSKLSDSRISAYETWPHGGEPPSVHYLANLASTFGHGCTPAQLVDTDDLEHLGDSARRLLTAPSVGELLALPAARGTVHRDIAPLSGDGVRRGRGPQHPHTDNVLSGQNRKFFGGAHAAAVCSAVASSCSCWLIRSSRS
jgi:hypothetical protein